MDFEDFCHYFTDVVVCRLIERTLLWPSSNWSEVSCYGEWTPAPTNPDSPPATVQQTNYTLTLGKSYKINKTAGTKQPQGNRKEARLGESQQDEGKRGRCNPGKTATKEEYFGEVDGLWEAQKDKRSRCGGCINHRDTFLHNPQVEQAKTSSQSAQEF